jgi:hypothetical protein
MVALIPFFTLPGIARLDNADEIAAHECPYIKLLAIGYSNFRKSRIHFIHLPKSAPS